MARPDLNLLYVLDALLDEGSVTGAARRLRLSPSAMSRALARLRRTTGDPLLVKAGRGLVPTPRALELREQIGGVVLGAEAALRPLARPSLKTLARTFTLRSSEGFVENFGPALVARVAEEAPHVRLWFLPKADKDSAPLREGRVDLETGVIEKSTGPELRGLALFRDRFIGVVRKDHPLARGRMTIARYAAGRHVRVARPAAERDAIDQALSTLGLSRSIATLVGGFSAAVALARSTDLIATVPERHTGMLREGLHSFTPPFAVPEFTVSLLWHPRMDGDPVHRWLRECVKEVCTMK